MTTPMEASTRFTRLVLIAAGTLGFAHLLPGQPTEILQGTRVRIEGARTIKGWYAGMQGDDSILVRRDAHDTLPLALSSLGGVAISKGRRGHATQGLKFGLISGAGVGLIAAVV